MPDFRFDPAFRDYAPALLCCAAFWLAGVLTLRLLAGKRGGRLRLDVAFAVGCAVGGWVLSLGAMAGLALTPARVGLVLVGFAAGAVLLIRPRFFTRGYAWMLPGNLVRGGWAHGAAWAGVVASLPFVLRPFLDYDVLSYHLPLAHAIRTGGMEQAAPMYYARLPLEAFALYAPLLSNRAATLSDPGVRVLLWAAVAASACLCGRIAGHLGARRTGQGIAMALYAWNPAVWRAQLDAHTDLLTVLFALGAFEQALSGLANGRRARFFLAGLAGGAAVAVKFTALGIVAVPLVALVAVESGVRLLPHARRKWLLQLAALGGGLAVGYGPWMLRAWARFGHPLHPFMGEAPGWSAEQAAFLLDQHRPLSPLSIDYVVHGLERLDVFGYALPGVGVSALLLAAVALPLLRWRARGTLLLGAVLMGYGAWLTVGLAPDRFVLALAGLCGALAAAALRRVQHRLPLRYALGALIGFGVLAGAAGAPPATYRAAWQGSLWRPVLAEELLLAAHEGAGEGRTLLLFEARPRLFPPGTAATTVWDVPQWSEELRASRDGRDFAGRLRKQGFVQVVVNEVELGRLVEFYGGRKTNWRQGEATLRTDFAEADALLAAYPPCRFAGLDERDRRTLLEFIALCRSEAGVRLPAGRSEVFLTPLSRIKEPLFDNAGELQPNP
ncbi:MAG: hypothetical protein PWP23_3078 [Candidatus Sumerlaeota bacterium]|nr:hypothetical protein [Candidatus Sumerlaeota bacterium]